jgi:hypothetical protein
MELYIKVAFWLGCFGLVINLIILMASKFPIARTESIGFKLVQILIGGAFTYWAASLVYF